MDPVTAFSIACGVIQVVDFSLQVLSNFRDFYKEGEIAFNAGVADQAADLVALESGLEELVAGGANAPSAHLSRQDLELRELARKCVSTAKELTRQLAALKPATGRKRDAFKSSIKSMWKRNEMRDIQEKLDEYRKALDTRVLVNLSKRSDLQSLENSKAFNSLHQNVQNLISALQQGHVTMEKLVRNEGILIRSHITQELNRLQPSKDAELTEQLRRSLYFPDIFVRREEVAAAHRSTFEWIFDESVAAMRPWDNYAQWLRNGRGIYWISGKAGSGKSTLMNFILEDERTKRALQEWSGSSQSTTPSFFFWSLGSKLQKSTSGLLRALVYQIIGASPILAGMLLDENPDIWPFGVRDRPEFDVAWTDKKLKAALRYLLNQSSLPLYQCFFIDGFDELEDGHVQTLELFAELEQNPRVKLCVASRPWAVFETAFKSTPRLRLQDLTRSDIKLYVEDKLSPSRLSLGGTSDLEWISIILTTIVDKADGCFLWCYLVVLTILDGLACGDELHELKQRLDILPTEIEGLYKNLLNTIHPVHKEQVTRLLRIQMAVSENETFRNSNASTLFVFALTAYLSYKNDLTWPIRLTDTKILEECERIKTAVSTKTKGLLEIYSGSTHKNNLLRELFSDIENLEVKFFHKSAFDFLRENNETLESFSERNSSEPDQAHFLQASLLAHILHLRSFTGVSAESLSSYYEYYKVFLSAGDFMELSRDPEEAVMDELCSIMQEWRASNKDLSAEALWAVCTIRQRGTRPWTELDIGVDDFLHHAAAHRMTPFVLRKIEQVSQDKRDEVKASLLSYALLRVNNHIMGFGTVSNLSTALEILKSGVQPNLIQTIRYADPSTTFFFQPYRRKRGGMLPFDEEITPWKQCLKSMLLDLTDTHRNGSDESTKVLTESNMTSAQDWMKLVELFLDAGANPNETITISFPEPLTTAQLFKFYQPTLIRSDLKEKWWYDKAALFWNISALRILQICFEEQPGYQDILIRFRLHGAEVSRSSPLLHVYTTDMIVVEHEAADLLSEEELMLLEYDLTRHEEGSLDLDDRDDLFPSFTSVLATSASENSWDRHSVDDDIPVSDSQEGNSQNRLPLGGEPPKEKYFEDQDWERTHLERDLLEIKLKQYNDTTPGTTPGITALIRNWEKNNQPRALCFDHYIRGN